MVGISIKTPAREAFVDITAKVAAEVGASGVKDGVCVVFVPHTTAGVTINENADPDVTADLLAHLQKLVPRNAGFRHAEGNSDAHLKAALMGFSVTVPVSGGRLALGVWQGIYFAEFDGPRNRNFTITILGNG